MRTPLENTLIEIRKLAKNESETINLSLCALPEPVGRTIIDHSNVIYANYMFSVHVNCFAWHIFYKGQYRGMIFSTGIVCLLVLLISKAFPFGTFETWNQENMIYCFAIVRAMQY